MEYEVIKIKCKRGVTMKNGKHKGLFCFIKGRYYEAVKTFESFALIHKDSYTTKNELGNDAYLTDRTLKDYFVVVG